MAIKPSAVCPAFSVHENRLHALRTVKRDVLLIKVLVFCALFSRLGLIAFSETVLLHPTSLLLRKVTGSTFTAWEELNQQYLEKLLENTLHVKTDPLQ